MLAMKGRRMADCLGAKVRDECGSTVLLWIVLSDAAIRVLYEDVELFVQDRLQSNY